MRQPIWKYVLSYFTDIHIESLSSEYNDQLDLYFVKGRYQLCARNAIYSYADKYDNFYEVFQQMDFTESGYSDVLLLGFGLGSIPYMLEKNFTAKFNYTGVEIDEEVIYLASKYVMDELHSEIQLIGADASHFMQLNQNKYDMICMDIFDDDQIPAVFESEEFLQILKDTLTPDGILIYNRLYLTEGDKALTDTFISQTFSKVFSNFKILISGGNKMLMGKL